MAPAVPPAARARGLPAEWPPADDLALLAFLAVPAERAVVGSTDAHFRESARWGLGDIAKAAHLAPAFGRPRRSDSAGVTGDAAHVDGGERSGRRHELLSRGGGDGPADHGSVRADAAGVSAFGHERFPGGTGREGVGVRASVRAGTFAFGAGGAAARGREEEEEDQPSFSFHLLSGFHCLASTSSTSSLCSSGSARKRAVGGFSCGMQRTARPRGGPRPA
jgi:hypothetical protein